jgi:HSP20 family protein
MQRSDNDINFMGFDMAVDVYEKDNQIIAEMNLPGIDPDQVNVEVEDGMLKISGERSSETTEGDESSNYHRREIRRGSFSRIVNLPESADTETCEANYKDGVLKISMNKRPESETGSKRLEIKRA